MHDEELLYYSLKRIASTIERIINNSKSIDDSQFISVLLLVWNVLKVPACCFLQ